VTGQTWSWKRAIALSLAAVYGPFVAMATYTTCFVSCSHCKAAAWSLAPLGPGLIPVDLGRRWMDLGRYPDGLELVLSAVVALLMVVNVALAVRRGRGWRNGALTVAALVCSVFAYWMMALIRA
jgi:hypothetical protein